MRLVGSKNQICARYVHDHSAIQPAQFGIVPVEQPSRGTIPMNYGLTKTRVRLAGGAAILALSAGAAMAQEGVESVVVSSTRLQSGGF